MKFFSPTSKLKELLLLQHIEKKADTTQQEIAKVIDGAPSMVNVYINKLEEKAYLERDYKSAKVVYYNITPEGVKRKNFLSITYFNELLQLYRLAGDNIERFLVKLEEKGYKNIYLYGAGEVAETLLGVIKDRKDKALRVLGLIDDNKEKQKVELLGYKIISIDEIKEEDHDGVVITSYTFEDEIMDKLEKVGYPEDKIERFFSK